MIKLQWFVKMDELAKPAMQGLSGSGAEICSRTFRTRFTMHWLDNIRDWCISRQLWWGHQNSGILL